MATSGALRYFAKLAARAAPGLPVEEEQQQTSTSARPEPAKPKTTLIHPTTLFGVPTLQVMLDEELFKYKGGAQALVETTAPGEAETLLSAMVDRLHQAVIENDTKTVDQLLTWSSSLSSLFLMRRGTVIDRRLGFKHPDRTAYQLALGAKGKDMLALLEQYFRNIPNYQAIMQAQYDEQYPADYKEIEAKEDARDDAAIDAAEAVLKIATNEICLATNSLEDKLHEIRREEKSSRADELNRITSSIYKAATQEFFVAEFKKLEAFVQREELESNPFDFTVLRAIYRFRNHWESKTNEPIKFGKHFNHKALDKAVKIYDSNIEEFAKNEPEHGAWKYGMGPKNIIFWQKIFGYIQRFLPACDTQPVLGYYHSDLAPGHNCASTTGRVLRLGSWSVVTPRREGGSFLDLMSSKIANPIAPSAIEEHAHSIRRP